MRDFQNSRVGAFRVADTGLCGSIGVSTPKDPVLHAIVVADKVFIEKFKF
jgi:hypothetical protein